MLVALSVLIFILLRLAPGDPIDAYINPSVPMSAVGPRRAARPARPRPAAAGAVSRLASRGARPAIFGYSIQRSGEPVLPLVIERIGPTLLLMGTGLAIAIVVGIAAGIFSAVRRNSLTDVASRSVAFVGISSPAFLTALLGLYFFSVLLRWAPSGGMLTPGAPFSFGDVLAHLVLPACCSPSATPR